MILPPFQRLVIPILVDLRIITFFFLGNSLIILNQFVSYEVTITRLYYFLLIKFFLKKQMRAIINVVSTLFFKIVQNQLGR